MSFKGVLIFRKNWESMQTVQDAQQSQMMVVFGTSFLCGSPVATISFDFRI